MNRKRELCPGLRVRVKSASPMPLAAGSKLDGYEVVGLLGAGGMGDEESFGGLGR
jgi:hypothetical protein